MTKARKKTKIFICGPTMIDFNIPVDSSIPEDLELMKDHQYRSNGKRTISQEESAMLMSAIKDTIKGRKYTKSPGGSMFNTAITIKSVMGNLADVTFLGMTSNDKYGYRIRDTLRTNEIEIMPKESVQDGECGFSYCIDPGGKSDKETGEKQDRSFATYPGNAKDVFTVDKVPDLEQEIQNSDVVMMSGSVLEKLNSEMAGKILEYTKKHKKKLVLSLPVDKDFAAANRDRFNSLILDASVVCSNTEELMVHYDTTDTEQALAKLQQAFQENKSSMSHYSNSGDTEKPEQVGFITDAGNGCYVVTADEIYHEQARKPSLDANGKQHLSGAGDTSLAGFALGYFNGISAKDSAKIAMALASEKQKYDGPRIPKNIDAGDSPENSLFDSMRRNGTAEMIEIYDQLFGPQKKSYVIDVIHDQNERLKRLKFPPSL